MAQVQVIDVIARVAQIVKNCPVTTLVDAYIEAAREFCEKSKWLTATIPGATIADTAEYSLGSDTYHEICGITAIDITVDSRIRPMTARKSSDWDQNDDNDDPRLYQYVPEGQFVVHPTPDQVYTLSIGVVMQPKMGSNSVIDVLLVKWKRSLERGALAYLLDMKAEPWYDPGRANRELLLFRADINHAHMNAQSGYNSGALSSGIIGPRSAMVRSKILVI